MFSAAVALWYASHPDYHNNNQKIFQLMRKDGWSGWKAEGPPLLAHCPFYRAGYLPARTHGWDATMVEYDRKSEVYEYGYDVGHRALFSLRPGESFVREAGNRGLHVNMDVDPTWDGLKAKAPENDLVYLKDFFPGYRGGVAANGVHRYAPNLAAGDLAKGALVFDNLASGGSPRPSRQDRGPAGRRRHPHDLTLRLSRRPAPNQGRRPIGARPFDRLDLVQQRPLVRDDLRGHDRFPDRKDDRPQENVLRRYAYWLRIEVTGGRA